MSETINVEVPGVGESITEVQIGRWLKQEGDWVREGEDLVELETEKASVQIPAPASGVLQSISKPDEEFAEVGEVIGAIRPGEKPSGEESSAAEKTPTEKAPAEKPSAEKASAEKASAEETSPASDQSRGQSRDRVLGKSQAASPSAASSASGAARSTAAASSGRGSAAGYVMPAAQRLLEEHGIDAADVPATGPGGRLLKEDVLAFIRNRPPAPAGSAAPVSAPASAPASRGATDVTTPLRPAAPTSLVTEPSFRAEEVKPMSMLRRTIAARLVEAQQTAALLTTFNEVDMQPVMKIRQSHKDAFQEKHGVKLGFMSFFAKAAVEALRRFPAVNAEIRDGSMVYRNYQDIGIAIGGGKGLVVPVLRNVERMSFADVEHAIGEYARQAQENRLQPDDLMGGTFTISNGGIYGSLLSTPIVNPPQSGILGLHTIQDRPVAVSGQVVIRPMMYLALTYDHRIVDGREAVGFLKTIKEVIEDPTRLFLEV